MPDRHTFKAKVDNTGHGHVFIDDAEVPMVTGFRISASVNDVTTIQLDLIAMKLDVELEGDISLNVIDN